MREAHRAALETCLYWYGRASYRGEARKDFVAAALRIENYCEVLLNWPSGRRSLPFQATDRLSECLFGARSAGVARNREHAVAHLHSACNALYAAEGVDRTAFAAMLVGAAQKHVP